MNNAGQRLKSNLLRDFLYSNLTPSEQADVQLQLSRWNTAHSNTRECLPGTQVHYTRPETFYHEVIRKYGWEVIN